tara:strand:+ start:308 stop:928 length:621 start_codon:yes stop_codon:yes gene_type:complete
MAEKVADLILTYQFIKRLVQPFDETDAFKNGIIDENGMRIKSKEIKTSVEKKSYGYYDRMVFNLKKLLEKLPGGKNKLASYAAALFLLKEACSPEQPEYTEQELQEGLDKNIKELKGAKMKEYNELFEDTPANATGTSVAGTGDDDTYVPVAKTDKEKKKKKKKILIDRDGRKTEMRKYVKAYMERRQKRETLQKRNQLRARMGLY